MKPPQRMLLSVGEESMLGLEALLGRLSLKLTETCLVYNEYMMFFLRPEFFEI